MTHLSLVAELEMFCYRLYYFAPKVHDLQRLPRSIGSGEGKSKIDPFPISQEKTRSKVGISQ